MLNTALGFRVHSGWAALVAVAEPRNAPLVIDRRRLELIDPRAQSAQQPYHAAKEMKLADAAAFLKQRTSATLATATASLQDVVSELDAKGYAVAGACVLLGSGRPTGDLAATLRSHAMIHTAEGQFFRNALQNACHSCGVPLLGVKEKKLVSRAVNDIRISPAELHRRIAEAGKSIGPPWRQDEKLSTLAGWLALANSAG